MNNILSTKRHSAIFLATLLLLGTISIILPSAQSQPYYEERYAPEYPSYNDNNDYKSKDSNVILNKIKCNNINDNLNNVDVNSGLPNGFDDIVQAQAADNEGQEITANGWGNDNGYKQNDNDIRFVCINNNDNENNIVVVNETTPIPPPPPTPPDTIACEECFTENENLTPVQQEAINALLGGSNPQTVTFFETQIAVNDLAALCTLLTLASTEEDIRHTVFQVISQTNAFYLSGSDAIEDSVIEEIAQCIIEALNNEV